MKEEKDKLEDIIDWLEPSKEPTDEELASLMQDGDAMSDIKHILNVQQAVARQGAAEEGLPFDLDKEWGKVSAFIDKEEEGETEEKPVGEQDAEMEEPSRRSRLIPLYAAIGIAASLLLFFVIRQSSQVDTPTATQNTALVYQRDSAAAQVAMLTSSDKSHAPRALQGEGIVMPKSEQQPATSAASRILQALGLGGEDAATQNNTVTIPPGKSYTITLSDGTKVYMYARSRITYPAVFYGNERRVYLEGEAYFKVTKDKAHPFVISTEKAEAKVLGTELNVSCYKGEPCHVALLTGSVLVSDKNATRSVKLVPGQGVTVNDNTPFAINAENMETYNYWLAGYIYYDDTPLTEIAKTLGRWYNVNVVFDNEALKTMKVRYFCQRGESLDRAVELLNSYNLFKASVEGETLHIK